MGVAWMLLEPLVHETGLGPLPLLSLSIVNPPSCCLKCMWYVDGKAGDLVGSSSYSVIFLHCLFVRIAFVHPKISPIWGAWASFQILA